ncbi:amidophosphoribosyltransferase [Clostridium sp. 'deep sea']|uniref:amidophosphoribosyltransferase n=1 Tax=Clostridium sp. 'deep sea' TaxID=2779445 RepID=UPI0018966986|nr:amidophosphoribosyltransferase [Clostridium sp. 'deep sea']QOR34769.1 amidophosphoribosyltransferase [Clostridium sp. 'deep sea']
MLYEPNTDKLAEECGVFGIYGKNIDLASKAYFGIFSLQHRGQESAGIAVSDGEDLISFKGQGLVSDVFTEDVLASLRRKKDIVAVAHSRYSTAGGKGIINAQPLVARYLNGGMALAHNGNLVNAGSIRRELEQEGYFFQTDSDTECILNIVARYRCKGPEYALQQVVNRVKGAYSVTMIFDNKLIGLRDPDGIRPLCLGKLGEAYVLASESCALTTIGAELIRDVEPGELVIIDENGITSKKIAQKKNKGGLCIFEYIYFARPDSTINGKSVYKTREEMGRVLAKQYPVEADIVTPVPDSGRSAAVGFAEESGIKFTEGLIKNRYVARTFIAPDQEQRELKVRLKLSPIPEVFEGKRVVLVDDSIVRGTTIKSLINIIKSAGAKEVHVRVSSPPYISPCFYGIDIPNDEDLIAASYTPEQICEYIGADSLNYINIEGLMKAVKGQATDYCTACFTGNYFAGRIGDD